MIMQQMNITSSRNGILKYSHRYTGYFKFKILLLLGVKKWPVQHGKTKEM